VNLSDKVVLLTGACGELGRTLIHAFAEAEATLALAVRQHADVESFERRLEHQDGGAVVMPCDLRYEEDVVRFVHRVVQRHGRVDVAINAATVSGPRLALMDCPVDAWRDVVDVNLTGMFLICREVAPWMVRQASGSIINVAPGTGASARTQPGACAITSSAVDGFTRQLATELQGTGVRVNTVDIGPPAKHGTSASKPDALTSAFLWLASNDSAATTGDRILASRFTQPTYE
jgi:NAD(P)-dependent dehydrogenase (short-subunit alcohol dehydrogenase family)